MFKISDFGGSIISGAKDEQNNFRQSLTIYVGFEISYTRGYRAPELIEIIENPSNKIINENEK